MTILGFIIFGILFMALVSCAFIHIICDPRDGIHRNDDDSGI